MAKLEEQLGTSLPTDYREFLLNYNGGVPSKACFFCESVGDTLWVDYLCLIDEHLATPTIASAPFSLAMALVGDSKIIPQDSIVVGRVCGEDLLVLFLKGNHRGEVHVKIKFELGLKSQDEWACEPERGLHFVAKSFRVFLEMLHEDPSAAAK
jgi:hypothetical protein